MRKSGYSWLVVGLILLIVLSSVTMVQAQTQTASITVNVNTNLGDINQNVLSVGMAATTDGLGVWNLPPNSPGPVSDMTRFATDIGVKFLRYTSFDNFSNPFDWKNAVGLNRVVFGLPEYLQFCQAISAKPIIVVTERLGTAQDAADLVEYLNAPNDGSNPNGGIDWAQVRAADGHPEPWNVVWFEFGNETWAYTSADTYVTDYINYQTAMKNVDQSIKLGAVLGNFFWNAPNNDWNAEVISETGSTADFYVIHTYVPNYNDNCCKPGDTACLNKQVCVSGNCFYPQVCSVTADNLFHIGLAGVNDQLDNYLNELNSLIYEITGRNNVPIAVTEFNGHFPQAADIPVPYRFSLGDALINAEFIRQFMHADNIAMSNFWNFSNEYWGMVKGYSSPYLLRPNYFPFYLYHNYFGNILIDVQTNSPAYEVLNGYGAQYGVSDATGTFQPQILDHENIINGAWNISPVAGVSASEDNNGILTINFDGTANVDYIHSQKTVNVFPNTWYRLTGLVKINNLSVGEGGYLAVQNGLNLVANSGFESDFSDWNQFDNNNNISTIRAIDSDHFTGAKSAKVTFGVNGSADNNYYHVIQYPIDVQPDTTYTLEGYIKTNNIDYQSSNLWYGITLEAIDVAGCERGNYYACWSHEGLKGTNDWTRVSMKFTTTPITTQIGVRLRRVSGGGNISGEAWWDDIRLANKISTRNLDGTNDWRYVFVDFNTNELNNPPSLTILAGGNARSNGVQNKYAMFKDVKLREITHSNNGAVPYLSVNASKSTDGNKVYLMVVNKDMVNDITATINLNNFIPVSAQARILNGPSVDATNEIDPNNVNVSNDNIGPVTNPFTYTFQAHSLTSLAFYTDNDGDGYTSDVDCNDNDPAIHPGATEICDGIDNNCNGQIDEGLLYTYYRDADGDGYGDPNVSIQICTSIPPSGYVTNHLDCNDSDASINPMAVEICGNDIDENCDGTIAICSPSDWYNDGIGGHWRYRQSINISAGMTIANLTNFPVLIKIADPSNLIFTQAQTYGDDIVFTDSTGLKLDHEIEKFDSATGNLVAWVKLPVLFSSTNTAIYMYYGNSSVTNQQNSQGVWDSNYVMVQHLSETSGQHFDSTSYSNDSTVVNVTSQGQTVTGKIGGSDEFDAFDDYINIPDKGVNSPLDISGPGVSGSYTLSAWIYARGPGEGPNGQGGILHKPGSYTLRLDGANCTEVGDITVFGSGGVCGTANDITTNRWDYVVYVYDSAAMTGSIYINSFLDVPPQAWTRNIADSSAALRIGEWGIMSFDGFIDEVRISNAARSPEWIAAEYNNQNNPGSYISFATQEIFCTDNDHDGYAVEGGACGAIDCNDNDQNIHPGAIEICNGIDDNCDGQIDEGVKNTYYRDADGDTFGNPAVTTQACSQPSGYVTNSADCEDTNAAINPSAVEICDNVDNNCNGATDENLTRTATCGVGACSGNTGIETCSAGTWGNNTCDPLAGATPEICDNIDNNCNGQTDEGLGQTTCGLGICQHTIDNCVNGVPQLCDPMQGASAEICDGLDNNCNGQVDDATNLVTPVAGPNGSISPSTPQSINCTSTASFIITPDTGYHIESVSGCDGSLAGNTYTTGPITAACTVTATFAINPVQALDPWTNIYSASPNNTNANNLNVGSFTVENGSKRLLLVSVVMETGSNARPTISAKYGGTSLTQIKTTNNNKRENVWMGYLNDSQIGSGSKALTITYSGASGGATALHVTWSSYTGVKQNIPVYSSAAAWNTGTTSVTFNSTINYVNNGMTVVVSGNGGTLSTGTLTAIPAFTAGTPTTANNQTSRAFTTATHTAAGSYPSTTAVTWTGTTNWSGIVVVSLQP